MRPKERAAWCAEVASSHVRRYYPHATGYRHPTWAGWPAQDPPRYNASLIVRGLGAFPDTERITVTSPWCPTRDDARWALAVLLLEIGAEHWQGRCGAFTEGDACPGLFGACQSG